MFITNAEQLDGGIPEPSSVNPASTQFSSGNIQESVDVFSGTLNLVQTDAVMPGINGLDISLTRKFNNNIWSVWRKPFQQPIEREVEYVWVREGVAANCLVLRDEHQYSWTGQKFKDWNEVYEYNLEVYFNRGLALSDNEIAQQDRLNYALHIDEPITDEEVFANNYRQQLIEYAQQCAFKEYAPHGAPGAPGIGGGAGGGGGGDIRLFQVDGPAGGLYQSFLSEKLRDGYIEDYDYRGLLSCYMNKDKENIDRLGYFDVMNSDLLGYGFGFGWSFSMSKISWDAVFLNESNRVGYQLPNEPYLVKAGGSQEKIFFSDDLNSWVTESFDNVTIINKSTIIVTSPSGVKYTYAWFARSIETYRIDEGQYFQTEQELLGKNGLFKRFLYLTKVEDEFGNYIKINYFDGWFYALPYIKSIETSTGKSITFGLQPAGAFSGQIEEDGNLPTNSYMPAIMLDDGRYTYVDSFPLYYYTNATYEDLDGQNIVIKYKYEFQRVKDVSNYLCYAVQCIGRELNYYPGTCVYPFLKNVSYYKNNELIKPPTEYEYDTAVQGDIYVGKVVPFDLKKITYPSGLEISYDYQSYVDKDTFYNEPSYVRRIFKKTINDGGNLEVWRYGTGEGVIADETYGRYVVDEDGHGSYVAPREHPGSIYTAPTTNDINLVFNDIAVGGSSRDVNVMRKAVVIKPDNSKEVLHYIAPCKYGCQKMYYYGSFDDEQRLLLNAYGGKVLLSEIYDATAPTNNLLSKTYYSYTLRYLGRQPASVIYKDQYSNEVTAMQADAPIFDILPQAQATTIYGEYVDGRYDYSKSKSYATTYRENQDGEEFSNLDLAGGVLVSEETDTDYDKYRNQIYSQDYGEVSDVQFNFNADDDIELEIEGGYDAGGTTVNVRKFTNWLTFDDVNSNDNIITKNTYLLNDGDLVNSNAVVGVAQTKNNINLLDNSIVYNLSGGELNQISRTDSFYNIYRRGGNNILVPHYVVHKGDDATSADINVSVVTFDSKGLVRTKKANNLSTYDYYQRDDVGRVVAVYNCLKCVAGTCRNPSNANEVNCELVTQYYYGFYGLGLLYEMNDANGNSINYDYDSFGRVTKIAKDDTWRDYWEDTDPNTFVQYDDNANKIIITNKQDENSNLSPEYYFYNQKGQLIQSRRLGEGDDNQVYVSSNQYDNMGRNTMTSKIYTDGGGVGTYVNPDWGSLETNHQVVHTYYDYLGRVTQMDNFDGSSVQTKYGLDWVETTNPDGISIKHKKDAFGNLISVTEDSGNENPQDRTFNYSYDSLNRLVQIRDAEGRITTNTYDIHSRPMSSTHPDTGTIVIRYDLKGNIANTTDANGNTVRNIYDKYNRITNISYSDRNVKVGYSYDRCYPWKLCRVNYKSGSHNGSRTIEYDDLGRINHETVVIGNNLFYIYYNYDISGNLIEEKFAYYKIRGNAIADISLTYYFIRYDYDVLNRLSDVYFKKDNGDWERISDFSYTMQGSIKQINYGNDVLTDYDYNVLELLKSINIYNQPEEADEAGRELRGVGGEVPIFSRYYQYDAVGNLRYLRNGIAPESQLLAEFTYDNLDRLARVLDNNYYGENYSFTYDDTGNRLIQTIGANNQDATLSYRYDNAETNRLTRITSQNANTASLSYDSAGNLVTKTDNVNDISASYAYNFNNMLKSVDYNNDGRPDESYYYDDGNKRVKKVESNKTTYYLYDQFGSMIYELCEGSACFEGECRPENFNWNGYKFIIQNSSGSNITMIDENGMMMTRGTVQQQFSNPNGNDFIIQNSDGEVVAWIDDATGNLYLRGSPRENVQTLPLNDANEYIIQNSASENVAWFDDTGNLMLKNCLYQSWT